mgnify:FL=1
MVSNMIESLYDKKTSKRIDDLANKQAKLDNKKANLADEIMINLEPETLKKVFELIKKNGHPSEKKKSEEIEKKYEQGEDLEFNDWVSLDKLYKSNFGKFSKEDDNNE